MDHSTPSIWLALDSRQAGGIETHVVQLANGLRDHGWHSRVVFLRDHGPHPMKDRLADRGLPWSVLDGRFFSLARLLRTARPSILHTHGYKAGIVGRLAARITGVPVVSTFHAGETGTGRVALYDRLDRWTSALSQQRIAVSQSIADRLPWPSSVMNNFVDVPDPTTIGNQIAFVGRLSHEKGPDIFTRLGALHPGHPFHVYGSGPMATELQRTASANIVFHGAQADMDTVWPRIGVLVMTSRHEGLPMAALEAMARGIPVIATNTGNLPALVRHGDNGFLCPVADIAAFDTCLSTWLTRKDQRDRWSVTARDTVQRAFSTRAVVPQVLDRYRQALRIGT
ncbi:MAG: glycosyltransferase family 4 protein [Gammaproteobacteria bacterium]|nr:glycosyltransferase family 4 protein [Gammaproteobacteria bacterium]